MKPKTTTLLSIGGKSLQVTDFSMNIPKKEFVVIGNGELYWLGFGIKPIWNQWTMIFKNAKKFKSYDEAEKFLEDCRLSHYKWCIREVPEAFNVCAPRSKEEILEDLRYTITMEKIK